MLKYCVGILGSPAEPYVEWSDEKLEELKTLGFNTMQLNIAWGCRPNDEPLNLEDIILLPDQEPALRAKIKERRKRVRMRLEACKKQGMRTIFHFGAPYNGLEPYQGKPPRNCINGTAITQHYLDLLERLAEQVPGIDDILVYTYDQDAWLCSEFSDCKNCRGVPLHVRLPRFLRAMCEKWAEISPDGKLWWESWELSAGQTLRIIQELPSIHFGLMAHSNIGEVQKARPVDLWFKNLAMLAKERGIPVVAELFMAEASEETEPLERIPCPSLTYMQIKMVMEVPGVVGIKEYYGLLPGRADPCLSMVGQVLHHQSDTVEACLERLAQPYGTEATAIRKFWELVADAYMLYPWDVSWFAREVGRSVLDHGWNAAFLRGQQCSTPSWNSSRLSIFMKTDDRQPHPWMLEDVQLRFELAAKRMAMAIDIGEPLIARMEECRSIQMRETLKSLDYFRRVCKGYALHLRQTNVAMLLRENKKRGEPLLHCLVEELRDLLRQDCENQQGGGRVVKIQEAYEKNPDAWLDLYLLQNPEDGREKGYFSLTTR